MLLRWLISAVGFAALKGEMSAMVRRASLRAGLTLFVILLWLGAFGFAVAALAVWLAAELGVIAACGILAAGFLVVGLVIQIALAISARKHARAPIRMPLSTDGQAPDISGLGSLAIVGIAGFLLGRLLFRK